MVFRNRRNQWNFDVRSHKKCATLIMSRTAEEFSLDSYAVCSLQLVKLYAYILWYPTFWVHIKWGRYMTSFSALWLIFLQEVLVRGWKWTKKLKRAVVTMKRCRLISWWSHACFMMRSALQRWATHCACGSWCKLSNLFLQLFYHCSKIYLIFGCPQLYFPFTCITSWAE